MGSVAAGCRAEEKGALLFYRFQFWADSRWEVT